MKTEEFTPCPECGKPLPAGSRHQLCPACLMAQALASGTELADRNRGAAAAPIPPEEIAARLPQFEVTECLGRGGMGVVYKARQKSLDRWVAIKILPPERVGEKAFADRFAREAAVLAKLSHPNIVTVHDFGESDGLFYIVMEYVDGVSLRDLLREGKLAPEQAVTIVPPICDALGYAHEHGIIHRDIKPENILLDKAGRVKVADFGIAKILAANGTERQDGKPARENVTRSALGTPAYSAPEQKSDPGQVDHRADIYSLGVVFYEMLTGELPGSSLEPPSRKVQIDVRLDEIVLRALERKPELRYQEAGVFKTQVETAAAGLGGASPAETSTRPAPDKARIGSAVGGLDQSAAADGLIKRRWEIVVWGFILAAVCVGIGWNLTPVEGGWIIGVAGVLLFLMSASLVLTSGNNAGRLKLAAQIVLLDGFIVACLGIWCAFHSPRLPQPWILAISLGCGGGVLYCWNGLSKLSRVESRIPDPLGYIAFFFAILSGLIPTLFYWLKPWAAPWLSPGGQQFMLWLTLQTAMAAVILGFVARRLRLGWPAAMIGGVNTAIWLLFFIAGQISAVGDDSRGAPGLLQEETLEIQRDGGIACRLKSSFLNRTDQALVDVQFSASDFLHIQKITDEHGAPLRFDIEMRRAGLFHYHVWLEPAAPPMGRVTYVSEGTMVGLIHALGEPGLFEYSMDHSPGYDGITERIERHKLPPGAKLVWKNTIDLVEEKVGDQVELHIDRRIPRAGHLDVRYRYKLPAEQR